MENFTSSSTFNQTFPPILANNPSSEGRLAGERTYYSLMWKARDDGLTNIHKTVTPERHQDPRFRRFVPSQKIDRLHTGNSEETSNRSMQERSPRPPSQPRSNSISRTVYSKQLNNQTTQNKSKKEKCEEKPGYEMTVDKENSSQNPYQKPHEFHKYRAEGRFVEIGNEVSQIGLPSEQNPLRLMVLRNDAAPGEFAQQIDATNVQDLLTSQSLNDGKDHTQLRQQRNSRRENALGITETNSPLRKGPKCEYVAQQPHLKVNGAVPPLVPASNGGDRSQLIQISTLRETGRCLVAQKDAVTCSRLTAFSKGGQRLPSIQLRTNKLFIDEQYTESSGTLEHFRDLNNSTQQLATTINRSSRKIILSGSQRKSINNSTSVQNVLLGKPRAEFHCRISTHEPHVSEDKDYSKMKMTNSTTNNTRLEKQQMPFHGGESIRKDYLKGGHQAHSNEDVAATDWTMPTPSQSVIENQKNGTELQQLRCMERSPRCFFRAGVCDIHNIAVSERIKTKLMNKRFGYDEGLVERALGDCWDNGTKHQQQRRMGISPQRFRRAAVCDSTYNAVSERMKARAMNKRFQEAEGLVEGAMDDGRDYGTEHQQQRRMEISPRCFRRAAVCDNTDKAFSERMKARAMNKRFGETKSLVEGAIVACKAGALLTSDRRAK